MSCKSPQQLPCQDLESEPSEQAGGLTPQLDPLWWEATLFGNQAMQDRYCPDPSGQEETPGLYPGVADRTAIPAPDSKKRRPLEELQRIILHSTGGSSLEELDAACKNPNTDAHYGIGPDGAINGYIPTDKTAFHAGDLNTTSIGIEHVAQGQTITHLDNKSAVAEQIQSLNLAPPFKERLLNHPDLQRLISDSEGHQIYEDITGAQKRSSHLLVKRLLDEQGLRYEDLADLDMSSLPREMLDKKPWYQTTNASMEAPLNAHEHLKPKSLGEGENILWFHKEMAGLPGRLQQLQQLISELETTPPAGLSPTDLERHLSQARAVLDREMETQELLSADSLEGLAAEDCQLPGEKSPRQEEIELFYEMFWERSGDLDSVLETLQGLREEGVGSL